MESKKSYQSDQLQRYEALLEPGLSLEEHIELNSALQKDMNAIMQAHEQADPALQSQMNQLRYDAAYCAALFDVVKSQHELAEVKSEVRHLEKEVKSIKNSLQLREKAKVLSFTKAKALFIGGKLDCAKRALNNLKKCTPKSLAGCVWADGKMSDKAEGVINSARGAIQQAHQVESHKTKQLIVEQSVQKSIQDAQSELKGAQSQGGNVTEDAESSVDSPKLRALLLLNSRNQHVKEAHATLKKRKSIHGGLRRESSGVLRGAKSSQKSFLTKINRLDNNKDSARGYLTMRSLSKALDSELNDLSKHYVNPEKCLIELNRSKRMLKDAKTVLPFNKNSLLANKIYLNNTKGLKESIESDDFQTLAAIHSEHNAQQYLINVNDKSKSKYTDGTEYTYKLEDNPESRQGFEQLDDYLSTLKRVNDFEGAIPCLMRLKASLDQKLVSMEKEISDKGGIFVEARGDKAEEYLLDNKKKAPAGLGGDVDAINDGKGRYVMNHHPLGQYIPGNTVEDATLYQTLKNYDAHIKPKQPDDKLKIALQNTDKICRGLHDITGDNINLKKRSASDDNIRAKSQSAVVTRARADTVAGYGVNSSHHTTILDKLDEKSCYSKNNSSDSSADASVLVEPVKLAQGNKSADDKNVEESDDVHSPSPTPKC